MAKDPHIYRNFGSFSGGLSDDAYFSQKGQFQYSEGIDIRRFPRFAQLQRKNTALFSTTNLVYCTIGESANGNTFFLEGGTATPKVYDIAGAVVYTDSGAGQGYNDAIAFTDRLYLFTSNAVRTITMTNATTGVGAWAANVSSCTGSTINTGIRSAVNYNDTYLFFGNGKYLNYIDKIANTLVVAVNTIPFSSNITGLSLHSDTLWIYFDDGKQFLMDIGTKTVVATKDWAEKIRYIRNVTGYDYVITGYNQFYSGVYINGGVQQGSERLLTRVKYDPVVSTQFGNGGYAYAFSSENQGSPDSIGNATGVTYIPAKGDTLAALYSYGSRAPGLPNSFSLDYKTASSGNAITKIGAVFANSSRLYFGWTDGTNFGVDYVELAVGTTGGYLTAGKMMMMTDDGGDLSVRKSLETVEVGAYVPTGCTITLKYIINGGTIQTYNTISTSSLTWFKFARRSDDAPVGEFNEIRWFIEFAGNSTNTPQLYNFKYSLLPL